MRKAPVSSVLNPVLLVVKAVRVVVQRVPMIHMTPMVFQGVLMVMMSDRATGMVFGGVCVRFAIRDNGLQVNPFKTKRWQQKYSNNKCSDFIMYIIDLPFFWHSTHNIELFMFVIS